jgi:conjugal transfer pilus assembly protein TraW
MKLLKTIFETIVMFCFFGICYLSALLIAIEEVQAKDFGAQGHTFEILEQDFLEVINAKLKAVDWNQFNQKIQDQTKDYVETPTAIKNITKAKESKEYFYDPTYVLIQDIRDHTGKLIHESGTKVNPLEFTSLKDDLLFIDGDDHSQVKFALKQYRIKNEKLKIILVKGSPLKLQRKEKIWIYFDQAGVLTTKLGITETPALVEQDGLKLKINTIDLESLKGGYDE